MIHQETAIQEGQREPRRVGTALEGDSRSRFCMRRQIEATMCKDGTVREHDSLKEPRRFDKEWVWGLQ